MTFFDSTPGGALMNALNIAAESDQKAGSQKTTEPSESQSRKISSDGLVDQFRKLLTHAMIKAPRTS